MSRFELLDIDHLVITTPRVEQMREMFVSKMKFRPCPFVSDEILRGKCRLSIQYSSTNDRALEENAEEEFGQEATPTESVTDVAFSVRNLDEILRRVCASDSGLIHHGAHYVGAHPRIGAHRRAVIKVTLFDCGNMSNAIPAVKLPKTAVHVLAVADIFIQQGLFITVPLGRLNIDFYIQFTFR